MGGGGKGLGARTSPPMASREPFTLHPPKLFDAWIGHIRIFQGASDHLPPINRIGDPASLSNRYVCRIDLSGGVWGEPGHARDCGVANRHPAPTSVATHRSHHEICGRLRASTDPMSETVQDQPATGPSQRRIHPRVAVTLLETIRNLDLPQEIFEAEDPAVTMPRRLGLSDAVKHQIDIYREAARKRQRLTDDELKNLIRLAIRRPDSQEVFFLAGDILGGDEKSRMVGMLPGPLAFALARRRVRRLLKANFGRKLGGFGPGSFTFEGRALPFIQADPGGDACALVTGLCQAALDRYFSGRQQVVHVACQALRGDICRWTASEGEAEGSVLVDSEDEGGEMEEHA